MSQTTYDFKDGNGPVLAHQHPNGGGWVADTAKVADSAYIGPNSLVYDKARVYDNAQVFENARVYDTAQVYGNAMVCGNVQVFGNAMVCGNAVVFGNAWVYRKAQVCGNAAVYGATVEPSNDNRDAIIAALRAEVKAARILGASSPLGFEFSRQQWEDAKKATDALGALNEERD